MLLASMLAGHALLPLGATRVALDSASVALFIALHFTVPTLAEVSHQL